MTTAPMGYTVVLRSEVGASAEEALLEYRSRTASRSSSTFSRTSWISGACTPASMRAGKGDW